MTTFGLKKRRPLSRTAARVLRHLIDVQDGRSSDISDIDARSFYSAVHVLADRYLVVIDGKNVRPRQRGRELLATSYYRELLR